MVETQGPFESFKVVSLDGRYDVADTWIQIIVILHPVGIPTFVGEKHSGIVIGKLVSLRTRFSKRPRS